MERKEQIHTFFTMTGGLMGIMVVVVGFFLPLLITTYAYYEQAILTLLIATYYLVILNIMFLTSKRSKMDDILEELKKIKEVI